MHDRTHSDNDPVRGEIFRAARMCAPCIDRLGVLTYASSPTNVALRTQWCTAVLLKHLAPAILAAHSAALSNGFRELLAVDALLDSGLAGPVAKASSAAGHLVARDYHAPAAERTLTRYFAALEGGKSRGHIATVLAAKAAIFHISPHMAISALVFLEMRAAPAENFWPCVEECLHRVPAGTSLLKAA